MINSYMPEQLLKHPYELPITGLHHRNRYRDRNRDEVAFGHEKLDVGKAFREEENREHKLGLDRMAAMLSRSGGKGYGVREDNELYGQMDIDPDPDNIVP